MQTPVLVGIAQLEQRSSDPRESKEPLALMLEALELAGADAGSARLLSTASSIRVVRGRWPYKNPAKVIGERMGVPGAQTCITPYGGNFVQSTVNQSALDIQAGRHDIILITGAECGNTQAKALKAGLNLRTDLDWQSAPGTPDLLIGEDVPMAHRIEMELGISQPIQVYPMFENALRHHLGESIDEHVKRISELWAGFSAVAAENPHAWIREAKSAKEIRSVSAVNRPVSFPYPKFMNSNSNVDQAAALILCSTTRARALGIDQSRWVYPWAGTDAHDAYLASHRDNFYESPAIRLAGRRALELAGLTPETLDYVDVYSCFPVAVQVGAREIGLDLSRPLTITGGLTFAGGPLNNYVMHSIARMVELLRKAPDSKGLITANGGYLAKHAFGVYAAEAPARPFKHVDLQSEVDRFATREVMDDYQGVARVESYTVMYGASTEEPKTAYLSALTDNGCRVWASLEDREVLDAMACEEFCGRAVSLANNIAHF
ncbi:MAG: acetyl-CoA acetyltransferase [Pseudomonadales bacterium]